jgi:hypothetical protein
MTEPGLLPVKLNQNRNFRKLSPTMSLHYDDRQHQSLVYVCFYTLIDLCPDNHEAFHSGAGHCCNCLQSLVPPLTHAFWVVCRFPHSSRPCRTSVERFLYFTRCLFHSWYNCYQGMRLIYSTCNRTVALKIV